MFDERKNYSETGLFFFTLEDDLDTKCNSPADKPGVFIIYVLKKSAESSCITLAVREYPCLLVLKYH